MENVCCAPAAASAAPTAAAAAQPNAAAGSKASGGPAARPPELYEGKIAGLYDLEKTLGSGHFAVVKLARHVFTGEKVAVKVIDKTKLDEVSRAHLFQEVRCMKLVQHPNVVRLYEVIDTQTKLYLILELGDGGDLYDYIMKHDGGLSEPLAAEYFRQIVRAISYCHQLHVVHRDLKPENVVFFEKLGVVKLTDFGFSNKFYPGQKLETSCGSLEYMAPEILLGDSYDAPAVDVWSLGVILFMLVCGRSPFQERNDSETLTKIMDCKYSMSAHISEECRELIGAMLVVAPDKRFSLLQIAEHRWLRPGQGADATDAAAGLLLGDDEEGLDEGARRQTSVPELLPLVSRRQVTDEDHAAILLKMVNGSIATKEEITEALEKNDYNHITATYFLLAERKLRSHRQECVRKPAFAPSFSKSRLNNPVLAQLGGFPPVPNAAPLLLRPPGAEAAQAGRIRKCSIVQEEDDDEEAEEDDDDDVTTTTTKTDSLNRRGSRSEGRLNITVAEITAEARALHPSDPVTTTTADILPPKTRSESQSSSRSSSSSNYRATGGCALKFVDCADITLEPYTTVSEPIPEAVVEITPDHQTPSCSVAALTTATSPSPPPLVPTRTSVLLASTTLNEIYEEGTDCGSSDSAATTPRSLSRHGMSSSGTSSTAAVRRSKLHKTRTASCSSSDASDDDSENRKKRAHKIVGDPAVKPFQAQRRDSYDDSSDSQDPGSGSAARSTGAGASFCALAASSGTTGGTTTTTSSNGADGNSGTSCQNGQQRQKQSSAAATAATAAEHKAAGYRRHRAGHRHRSGETRLRESQSLNRITEVQESESVAVLHTAAQQTAAAAATAALAFTATCVSHTVSHTNLTSTTTLATTRTAAATVGLAGAVHATPAEKSRGGGGFSARLFHGFRKPTGGKYFDASYSPVLCCASGGGKPLDKGVLQSADHQLAVDLSGALKHGGAEGSGGGGGANGNRAAAGAGGTGGGTSTVTKKLKILGRYFQVNSLLSNNLKF